METESDEAAEAQKQLWGVVTNKIDTSAATEEMSTLELGLYLLTARGMFKTLATEDTSEWKYDFMLFARKKSRGRDPKTVLNYIRVADVFIANRDKLEVPDGLKFNPWTIKYTNLLVTAHAVKVKALSKRGWEMLADPETDQHDLINEVKAKGSTDEPEQKIPLYYVEADVLYFFDMTTGESVGLTSIEYDDSNPSVEEGWQGLINALPKLGTR